MRTMFVAGLAAIAALAAGGAHAQVYGTGQTYPYSQSGSIVSPVQANPLGSWNGASLGGQQGGYGQSYGSVYNPSYVTTNQYGTNTGYQGQGFQGGNGTNYVQGQSPGTLAPKVQTPDDFNALGRTGTFANAGNASASSPAKADPAGERLEGMAKVVDGKTLTIGGTLVVLNGADAPGADQTCTDPRGMPWECGRRAKDRLNQLVAGQRVVCIGVSQARNGTAARCRVGTVDLGRTMVQDGFAMSPKAVAPVYSNDQSGAENAKRGMWVGTFKNPWEVRAAAQE